MSGNGMLGLGDRALQLCEYRASILARNLANSSTPNYKAQDFDFHSAMAKANAHYAIATTDVHHMQLGNSIDGQKLLYRTPMQTSLDNNTVDDELERKNFIENSIQYQASLGFVQNQLSTLMRAIKGE